MGKLDGKVAIITASTEGIGLAIAERLAKDGAKVVISSRQQSNVDAAVSHLKKQGLQAVGRVCDVVNKEERAKLLEMADENFGRVDIIVCNAGFAVIGPIFETTEADYDKVMNINLKSTFFFCKEAFPYLQKQGGGSIILVSSTGAYVNHPLIGVYSISKTAMLGLTKALAPQLADSNIRINCIAPAIIETKMSIPLRNTEELKKKSLARYPMKRYGKPEECAGAVSFLVSDDASYITGETVIIGGGFSARL